jgi:hypothetical protein
MNFVRDAARLVRPSGYLVVGVPSIKAVFGLLHYDPLSWPPHHISRWRGRDLAALARHSGLALVKQGHDMLYGRAINWAWNLHNRYLSALGRPPLPGAEWLPRTCSKAYRLLGCKHVPAFHGLSIYAIMQKPE